MSDILLEKWVNKKGTALMFGSVFSIFNADESDREYGYKNSPALDGGIIIEDMTETTLTVIVVSSMLSDKDVSNKFYEDFLNYGYVYKSSQEIQIGRNGRSIAHQEIVFSRKLETENKDLDTGWRFEGGMKSDTGLVSWVESNAVEYPLKLGF